MTVENSVLSSLGEFSLKVKTLPHVVVLFLDSTPASNRNFSDPFSHTFIYNWRRLSIQQAIRKRILVDGLRIFKDSFHGQWHSIYLEQLSSLPLSINLFSNYSPS